jgi:hypothetical protein
MENLNKNQLLLLLMNDTINEMINEVISEKINEKILPQRMINLKRHDLNP